MAIIKLHLFIGVLSELKSKGIYHPLSIIEKSTLLPGTWKTH